MHGLLATAQWYAASLIVTVAFAPAAFLLFRPVRDRGASVARPLASLVLVWPAWLLASIAPDLVQFTRWSLLLTIAGGGAVWYQAWRRGVMTRAAIRHLALAEALFLVAFLLFLGFHGFGPAIWDQEKPSDLMMLSSSMQAERMPPNDAWLAGETINYYYVGYLVLAGVAKLAGTTPWDTYNLALATLFGMTVVGLAGLAGNLLGPLWTGRKAAIAGALSTVFVVVLGNPWAAMTVAGDPGRQWDADQIPGKANTFVKGIGWESTRIIFDDSPHEPITEFPFFTFILSDLHPHLIALPFAIMALAFAWLLLHLGARPATGRLVTLAIAGGAIGALYGINAWDYPTYLLIALVALWIGLRERSLIQRLAAAIVLGGASIVAWFPFHAGFTSPTRPADTALARATDSLPVLGEVAASIAPFRHDRTSIPEYLAMFGFMYAVAVAFIAVELWSRRPLPRSRLRRSLVLAIVPMLALGAVLLPAPLVALLGLPVLGALLLISADRRLTLANTVLALFAGAFLLTLCPEFVYLRDYFDTRMNTVFKVYFQVWLLMGVATAGAVMLLWSRVRRAMLWRWALAGGLAAILVGGSAYPVVAGKQWLDWRSPEREWVGIDGLAYAKTPDQAGEYEALRWLWEHGRADDVMLSAGGCEWSTVVGRPAAATGVPTILGWTGHEVQWHLNPEDDRANTTERASDITALYERLPPDLLDKYGVTLLYVGVTERHGGDKWPEPGCAPGPFPTAGDADFPGPGWTEVFAQEGVRIYRRDGT